MRERVWERVCEPALLRAASERGQTHDQGSDLGHDRGKEAGSCSYRPASGFPDAGSPPHKDEDARRQVAPCALEDFHC
jgi:hypothetical protein